MASPEKKTKRLKIVVIDADIDIEHSENITVDDLLKVIERLLLIIHDRVEQSGMTIVHSRVMHYLKKKR
jgi:hypothetical protein